MLVFLASGFYMNFDYDELLDHCIDSLLRSDVAAVDECISHLPVHYHTFLFLRLNTLDNENLQRSLCTLISNPNNATILSHRAPATGLCCDELKRHNFTRCGIWADSGFVNLEQLYKEWRNTLAFASHTTLEQGIVFFSQQPYYSSSAHTIWDEAFNLWGGYIVGKQFFGRAKDTDSPLLCSAFVPLVVRAHETIKSQLFWRCVGRLDCIEDNDEEVTRFLRTVVDQGCNIHLPEYPIAYKSDNVSGFVHDIEQRMSQLKSERLKRLAGIEDAGNDSGRRKI